MQCSEYCAAADELGTTRAAGRKFSLLDLRRVWQTRSLMPTWSIQVGEKIKKSGTMIGGGEKMGDGMEDAVRCVGGIFIFLGVVVTCMREISQVGSEAA